MLQYHPRAETINPQGRKCKPSNQWANPPKLQRAIQLTFQTRADIFASPLNCSMEPDITYCTTHHEVFAFGALYDAFSYRLTGSCTANPEYDPGDMRKAILHALASSTGPTIPFLVVVVLPIREDAPWYSETMRSNNNIEMLIHIPSGHMIFIPAHKQTDSDTNSPPSAE